MVTGGGLAFGAVGAVVLSRIDGTGGLAAMVIGSVVMAIGLAVVATLGTDLIVGAAPTERAGAAAALSETATELGGALGIAILGSLGTAVYRRELTGALLDGIPPQVSNIARDTLGGAMSVADQLPAGLVAVASEAFAHGLQLAAITTAGGLLSTAIVVLLLLREARPTAPAEEFSATVERPMPSTRVLRRRAAINLANVVFTRSRLSQIVEASDVVDLHVLG